VEIETSHLLGMLMQQALAQPWQTA